MATTYRRGITFTEAYTAAMQTADVRRLMLDCYELWHETMLEPFRWVDDRAPFTATLEAGAPLNAGEEVQFLPLRMASPWVGESADDGSPTKTVSASNVSGLLGEALRNARGSRVPFRLILRRYASDDPSQLAEAPPAIFTPTSAEISAMTASISANVGDPVNVSVPTLTFKREEYPTLAA